VALQRAASRRGAKGQAYTNSRQFTYSATYGGSQLEGEPYTVARAATFPGFRSRILAGARTITAASRSGWRTTTSSHIQPTASLRLAISYDDIAPYYDKAERFIGVTGSIEGIRSAPMGSSTAGQLRRTTCSFQRSCAKNGNPCRGRRARQSRRSRATGGCLPLLRQCGAGAPRVELSASYVQIFPP